jgi:hypothetical protein
LSHLKLRKSEAAKQSDEKYFVVAEVSKLRQKNRSSKIVVAKSVAEPQKSAAKPQQQNHNIITTTETYL